MTIDYEQVARDKKMWEEHERKYEEMAQAMGVDYLIRVIEKLGISPYQMEQLYIQDPHLNNIPLQRWVKLVGWTNGWSTQSAWPSQTDLLKWDIFPFNRLKKPQSCSDRVCVLKHVATHQFITPERVILSRMKGD